MNVKKMLPLLLVLASAIAMLGAAVAFFMSLEGQKITSTTAPRDGSDLATDAKARIAKLKDRISQEKAAAEDAVSRYAPTTPGRIDELTTPAADLLGGLPFVAKVEVALRARRPACRIIQIRDYHFVPPDLFHQEIVAMTDRMPTVDEGGLLYQEHLLRVELVQVQQLALLRCLVKHHGLKTVHMERLTAEGVPEFKTRVAALKEADPHQDELRRQLAEVQALLKKLTDEGKAGSERYAKAQAVEKEIVELLEHHRLELLELGAVARLLVAGELREVLPLDDAKLLDAAKPKLGDGKLASNPFAAVFREAWMARTLTEAGPVAVAVLGGAHNLKGPLGTVGGVEYLRVTVRAMGEVNR
jgi:hypothetical protein